ncbi:DUF302 domain-containing protein [Nocardia sp. NPDC050710]|uniref:DUF302 domain-containing protein n=1 Tax=Nocardia sp. NPDC050710 TaxID=3157220 RepID=UPI0033CCFEAF
MTHHVTVVESTPHTVLELHRSVHADHAGDDIVAGMRALYELATITRMAPAGPPSTTYLGEFGLGTSTDVIFGLPVIAGPLDDATEEVTVRRTEPGLSARTVHHGHYQSIGDAYRALDDWLRTSEYQPAGPPTEVYLVAPDEAVHPHDLRTEIRIPVAPAELAVRIRAPFADTVAAVRNALAEQGFGVLTEIDMRATLWTELGVELEDYVILGACSPRLAHRALEVDRCIGLLLPCNVVVRADGEATLVEAVDPDLLVRQTGRPTLRPIAQETRTRVTAALESILKRSSAGE